MIFPKSNWLASTQFPVGLFKLQSLSIAKLSLHIQFKKKRLVFAKRKTMNQTKRTNSNDTKWRDILGFYNTLWEILLLLANCNLEGAVKETMQKLGNVIKRE